MFINEIIYLDDKIIIKLFIEKEFTRLSCVSGFNKHILRTLPGLKNHDCYNDDKRSFVCEFRRTETAHAFEHILIEYILGLDRTAENVVGWTRWNWDENPEFTYTIEINYTNRDIFSNALQKALFLISQSINSCRFQSNTPFYIEFSPALNEFLNTI